MKNLSRGLGIVKVKVNIPLEALESIAISAMHKGVIRPKVRKNKLRNVVLIFVSVQRIRKVEYKEFTEIEERLATHLKASRKSAFRDCDEKVEGEEILAV